MKKVLAIVLAALLIVAALAGCAAKSETADTTVTTDTAAAETTDGKLEVLKVGASSTPHAEILEQVKDTLAAEGYDLQIVVYDDYVLPNQSLADGSLDANYFQHTPYLNSFNAANGTDLVSAAKIHYEPFGLYGNGVDSVDAIASDATILIPADDSNETRALLLLAQEGLIELPADASAETPSEKPRSTADGISCARRKSYKSRANCRIVNGALPRGDLPCPRVSSTITR